MRLYAKCIFYGASIGFFIRIAVQQTDEYSIQTVALALLGMLAIMIAKAWDIPEKNNEQ